MMGRHGAMTKCQRIWEMMGRIDKMSKRSKWWGSERHSVAWGRWLVGAGSLVMAGVNGLSVVAVDGFTDIGCVMV